MKLWTLSTFLTVSILTFSGCVATTPKPKSVVDSTLPIITLTEHGVFTDMKAVGFEWASVMADSRVEGIYVYKKELDSKEQSNKFYDTITNRFVTHYLDSDVKPATEYSYVFKTYTKNAESVSSREVIAKTLPALASVSWIHVLQEMPRSAKILWRPHTNEIVQSYIIERKTLADDKWKELAVVKGRLNAEYIDMNLKDSHVYKYRIRTVTYNDIISAPSKEVKVLTKALPTTIEHIIASTDLAKKIILTWEKTNIKDFSIYKVYRSSSIDGSYDLVTSTKNTEFIDKLDRDGEDYFYRVSVVDKDGLESRYEERSIHGKTLSKPIAPSLLAARMIGNNLEINWKSSDPRVKSYVVEKLIKKSWIDSQNEEFININTKFFIDKRIEPMTTYYYKVYAVDAFKIRSEASTEVKFTTTAKQGRIIKVKKPNIQQVKINKPTIQSAPVQKPAEKSVVTPMDDFNMSNL